MVSPCSIIIYMKIRPRHPAIYFVIPAVAKQRAGIQEKSQYYWIPAFAGKTE